MAACRGGVLLVVDDPQGDLPARVGSIATDGVCWYQKLYGGNTAFGWYRMPSQWHSTTQHLESWVARGNTTANSFTVLGLGAPNGLIAGRRSDCQPRPASSINTASSAQRQP